MRARFLTMLAAGVIGAAFALPAPALQIEGLNPVEPVTAGAVTPVVSAGTLQIKLSPQRMLSVAPWPTYLPQHFDAQSVTATRQLQPAGPVDRVSFSDGAGKPAWLEIGNGARASSTLIGAWRLQLSARGWSLKKGRQHIALADSKKAAEPATVAVGSQRWCIYLLESRIPPAQAGLINEQEPQMAWAALRLGSDQKRCAAPRAAPR